MNKNLLVVMGVVAVVAVGFIVFNSDGEITNYPSKTGPIIAFGDSLVRGVGASEGNDFISLMSAKVGEQIINAGVSGDTTIDGLARVDSILEKEPRITIVLLGGNDFLRKVPREQTFINLKNIIQKLQESGSIVILLGVRGGLLTDTFDSYYENLAEETGSAYVSDVLSGLIGDSRYMSDAIHPNDAGYKKIAERVLPVLAKVLR